MDFAQIFVELAYFREFHFGQYQIQIDDGL